MVPTVAAAAAAASEETTKAAVMVTAVVTVVTARVVVVMAVTVTVVTVVVAVPVDQCPAKREHISIYLPSPIPLRVRCVTHTYLQVGKIPLCHERVIGFVRTTSIVLFEIKSVFMIERR